MESREKSVFSSQRLREPLHRKGQAGPVDGQKARAVLSTVEQRTRDAAAIEAISRKYGEINVMTRKTRRFSTNCDNAMGRGDRDCNSRERTAPPKSSLRQEAVTI